MSSLTTVPSYKPAEGRTKALLKAGGRLRSPGKIALVIPALREAENLGEVLSGALAVLEKLDAGFEILVVDDDSGDGTEEIVEAVAGEHVPVRLLVRRNERGLAGAILHGWRHTDAEILGVMDADGQHPAEVLGQLLGSIRSGCDLAIGSRYARGASGGGESPLRRAISAAATWAARPLQAGWPRVRDPLSGFFLVRRRCVEDVAFQAAGFKLLLEILVRGKIGTVAEVPIRFARRKAGRSKVSLRVAWDYLALLARLYGARREIAPVPETSEGD